MLKSFQTNNIILLVLILISRFSWQADTISDKAYKDLEKSFKNFDMSKVKTTNKRLINSLIGLIMEEFNLDIDYKSEDRIDPKEVLIPSNLVGSSRLKRKNAGLSISLTADTINQKIENTLPKILTALNKLQLPFHFIIGPVEISKVRMVIDKKSFNLEDLVLNENRNSIDISIKKVKVAFHLDSRILSLFGSFTGTILIETVVESVYLRTGFSEDTKRYYFKPRVYFQLMDFIIPDINVIINSDFINLPTIILNVISVLFKSEIKSLVKLFLEKSINESATLETNGVINSYYKDNFELESGKLAMNALLTQSILVKNNQLFVQMSGEFFNPSLPYSISDSPTQIPIISDESAGIRVVVASHIVKSLLKNYLSRPEKHTLQKTILSYNMVVKAGFSTCLFEIVNNNLIITNLKIGIFCSLSDEWNCATVFNISIIIALVSFDPNTGVLILKNGNIMIGDNPIIGMNGFPAFDIQKLILNATIIALIPERIELNPIPIPDQIILQKMDFQYLPGYLVLETNALSNFLLI